MQKIQVLSFYI